ncbi:hypothetical protein [Mucilaginibacter paludis]|uniref:Uncharacterized protein n=1 Tax=Mucilaginibacter paludis DSM 18603 TaxID=714943 RepID=H1YHX8_9SPHI|nr:hypothetical protein [Mucilaginibacter paludis]EHQ25526.1 hypothetical protein Mucpa_1364 [Mucilaginibacter paludis DSM 18603]
MNFISKDPAKKYPSFPYNGLRVFVSEDDLIGLTISKAVRLCDKHGLNYNAGFKAAQVYYLRGRVGKAEYGQVLIGIIEAEHLPAELNEIVHCLQFWNQEGVKNFNMNKEGQESYQDFILRCIAADCRAFVQPHADRFITGKGGNHVWVSDRQTDKRILIIHF